MTALAGRLTILILFVVALCGSESVALAAPPYGMDKRVVPRAWLNMPRHADGAIPKRLSQTGAFVDTRRLIPAPGLLPYDLIVSFWSDGASKQRLIALPAAKIKFSATGEWQFPPGTVFVKTFELPIDPAHPELKRRLETRLLVRDADGGVYGAVYKWRADNSDADLLNSSLTEEIGGKQTWYY